VHKKSINRFSKTVTDISRNRGKRVHSTDWHPVTTLSGRIVLYQSHHSFLFSHVLLSCVYPHFSYFLLHISPHLLSLPCPWSPQWSFIWHTKFVCLLKNSIVIHVTIQLYP
jgi:hypothetical protein